METILIYALKVSVALILFYGIYIIFLRNDTFLKLRRFYFLFVIAFSLLYPACNLEFQEEGNNMPIEIPVYWISQLEMEVTANVDSNEKSSINYPLIITVSLLLVSLFLFLRFLLQISSVLFLRLKSPARVINNETFILLDKKNDTAFSFFHWVFINYHTIEPGKIAEIISHEKVHVRQWHSIDVVISELLCIFLWWNPVAWLIKKEIKSNLEYLADRGVLNTGFDCKQYQYALLHQSCKNTGIYFINNFNVSQLKKRIAMMNKRKSPALLSAKYLLVIPVGLVLIIGNAVQATTNIKDIPSDVMNIISPSPVTENTEYVAEEYNAVNDAASEVQTEEKPFVSVEQMPQFPGGVDEQIKFITTNLKYPQAAINSKTEGRVVVRFIVSRTGEIKDIDIVRKLSPETDAEAVRVISAMPKWIPGKQNGKEVDVYFTMPIIFKLTNPATNSESSPADDKPFVAVQKMPQFPGGNQELMNFIATNLKYPQEAIKNGTEGRVLVRFIVSKTGEIKNAEIVQGLSTETNNEALRVVRMMPKWIPGEQKGKGVDVYFTLPIMFALSSDNNEKTVKVSLKNKHPLILIDGEIKKVDNPEEYLSEDAIKKLTPNTIKSINVLKDQAAIEKYGEKGKDGVIIIETIK